MILASFSTFLFSGREISFDLRNDNILEHTEEGELEIAPDPINFDGHTPLFNSVRISIKDDEGKYHTWPQHICSSEFSVILIILPAVALVTLNVPPVIHEPELEFTATVLLVRPQILTQASLGINLMDTEITALNPG